MSASNTIDTKNADEARQNFLAFRKGLPLARPAPALAANNPLLPPTADDTDYQLPARFQGQSLQVEVPEFDVEGNAGLTVIVRLMWDGALLRGSEYRNTLPIPPGDFPLKLALPPTQSTQAGPHALTYNVNVQGNATSSDPLNFSIDRMAPNGGNAGGLVILPPEIEANGITKEYLDANGSVLITVPGDYADRKIGDIVTVYFGSSIPTAVLVGTIPRGDTTSPLTIPLTAAQVGNEEGTKTLFYTLQDRVGNIGLPSEYKPVEVILTPAPADLKPLTIPLAAPGDDLIDPQDASLGVDVQIEAYTHYVAGDVVEVTWGGIIATAPAVQGSATLVRIPYSALLNGGGTGKGPKDVDVTYAINRGRSYPEGTVVSIKVDLRTPGPENPDIPDPVNPDLDLVTVRGAVSAEDNKLTEDDAGQPASATLVIYEPHLDGEFVQLYWNRVAVPAPGGVYKVDGTEPAGFIIPFIIPWNIIDAAGNNSALPVHYSITHPLVNAAEVLSPDQPVEVSVRKVTLPDATFLNLDEDFGNLNCQSLRNVSGRGWVVEIHVDGGEPALAGQLLNFTYQGHNKAENRDITFPFTYKPTDQEASAGFNVYLDYEPLRDTRDGPGSIEYTAKINGFERTSPKHTVDVWMGIAGGPGLTCELTRSANS